METKDPWRKAILKERESGRVQPMMINTSRLVSQKQNALILGDACLVNSNYLLNEAGFSCVINVDTSISLLDNDIISLDDKRLERIVSSFDEYDAPESFFDFIYGKSIAFNSKVTIELLMDRLQRSLRSGGIFSAVWAGAGDTFRPVHYTEKELVDLYEHSGFTIKFLKNYQPQKVNGLLSSGVSRNIIVTATK